LGITIKEQTAASVDTPETGKKNMFLDSADSLIKTKDSSATVDSFQGEANTASNLGTGADGEGLASSKVGIDLPFKRIKAGTNVTVTPGANSLTISATDTGEANTASNVGAGSGIFKQKTGVNLELKTLVAGSGITITPNTDDLTISATSASGDTVNPSTHLLMYEDFVTGTDAAGLGTYQWAQTAAGTGPNIARIDGEAGRPGILRLSPGTSAAARAMIYLGLSGQNSMVLAGAASTHEAHVRITGSVATFQRFQVGLADPLTTNGQSANSLCIETRAANANWLLVARAAGTETVVDTGVAHVSGNWVKVGFVTNAGATSIQAYINGTAVGTAITTNIPSVAMSPMIKADALAAGGGSNVPCDSDYYYLKQVITTPR
jgi:hypothetical protein